MISRREMMAMTAAGMVAAPSVLRAQTLSTGPSLGEIAATKGIRFGSAIGNKRGDLESPEVKAIILRECKVLVATNEMKMYTIRNQPEPIYDFVPGDKVLTFADDHGLPLRGHTLMWAKDEFLPKWLLTHDFGPKPKVAAEALLREYIGTMAGHYGRRITSWDVINEAIDEKTGEVRANVFTRILGDDVFRICFEAAREHLPQCELVYNDYMSWRPKDTLHREAVLKRLRLFRDQNIPVDTLGIQGHIGTDQSGLQHGADDTKPDYAAWTAFLNEVSGMGYDMLVTEFDVNDRLVVGDIARRDAVVAETAKTYFDLTLANTRVKDVLCWGMDDKHSWLQSTTPREDRLPLRPTPYDDQFRVKPLREALAAAFRAAPAR